MATIQHSSLTDSDGLHEPKGVATATSGDVYVADGAGSGSWDPLEGTEVASTGETGGTKFLREDGDNTCSWQAVAISTDVSGLGTGVATFLGTPSSANLISAVTDETGTGALVFATSPTLVTPALGTPASGDLSNCTNFPMQYGGMVVTDDTVAIGSIGTTPAKLTAFTDDSPNNGVTPDSTTDNDLTVTVAGDYLISFTITFSTVAAGDAGIYQFRLRVNGSESATGAYQLGMRREMSGSSDTGSGGFDGIVTLAASDVLTIYVESDDGGGGDDINVHECSFTATLLKAS